VAMTASMAFQGPGPQIYGIVITRIDRAMKTINPYTQDLYGREVDGWYWVLLEEEFRDCSIRYRAKGQEHAASIADRLAETADDVPAQLMQEYQDLWNDIFDYPDCQSPAVLTYEELEDELACGYSPENATAFVLECISRITGARAQ